MTQAIHACILVHEADSMVLQEIWGLPKDEGYPQPIRDTVKTVVRQQQQAAYQSFLKDRQHRNTHHPKGGLDLYIKSVNKVQQMWILKMSFVPESSHHHSSHLWSCPCCKSCLHQILTKSRHRRADFGCCCLKVAYFCCLQISPSPIHVCI